MVNLNFIKISYTHSSYDNFLEIFGYYPSLDRVSSTRIFGTVVKIGALAPNGCFWDSKVKRRRLKSAKIGLFQY